MKNIRLVLSNLLFDLGAWLAPSVRDDDPQLLRQRIAIAATHTSGWLGLVMPCEWCGRRMVASFTIASDIWAAVAEDAIDLCLSCFDREAERRRVRYDCARSIAVMPWYGALDPEAILTPDALARRGALMREA